MTAKVWLPHSIRTPYARPRPGGTRYHRPSPLERFIASSLHRLEAPRAARRTPPHGLCFNAKAQRGKGAEEEKDRSDGGSMAAALHTHSIRPHRAPEGRATTAPRPSPLERFEALHTSASGVSLKTRQASGGKLMVTESPFRGGTSCGVLKLSR